MTLATVVDLQMRLGRDLTQGESARVEALLSDVSAAVAIEAGQKFERSEHQVRARVKRGMVRLSQRPVHDVVSVEDRFGTPVAFTWDGLDRVLINTMAFSGCPPVQVVDVVYDAGPDEVPPAIVGVVSSIVLRALGVDPTEGSVVQESIDGYAYTIGSAGGAGAFGVLPDEMRVLRSFRRPYGSIRGAW